MQQHLFTFLSFAALFATVSCQGSYPETFEINLDDEPMHRYDAIILRFKPVLLEIHKVIMEQVAPYHVQWLFNIVYHILTSWIYPEMADEIQGIADILEIPSGELFTLQCYYELSVLCTSIVARNPDGRILLGRNLDFEPVKLLQQIFYRGVYTTNGKTLFECSGLAGYIGVITCFKNDKFAISLNARYANTKYDFIINLIVGRPFMTWVIRDALTNAKTYNQAFKIVTERKALFGSYIIISGTEEREGAVITRDANKAIDIRKLDENNWFLVQCNNDPWDIAGDERTLVAIQRMKEIGPENVTLEEIANKILLQAPNLRDRTVSTSLMSPEENYMISYIPAMVEPSIMLAKIKQRKFADDVF